MMISPESYYNEFLKDKNAEEILSVIHDLENEIKKLERRPKGQCIVSPSIETRISCNKQYLERARQALLDLGVNYKDLN